MNRQPTSRRSFRSRFTRTVGYLLYLFLVVFAILEIALRIYNPFHLRLKGDRIVLPVSQRTTISNNINPKLDPVIVNTRNSLGFRGPEKPADFNHYLSIITVGGSTTECHFLNDDKTWPFLLSRRLAQGFPATWLDNAGLDGHSTFGHQVLLNDYLVKIRPRVIIFLVGINDVENEQPSFHDKMNTRGAYPDFWHFIFENSEVLNLCLNLSRGWRAQKMNNTTQKELVLQRNHDQALPDSLFNKRIADQQQYLPGFEHRIIQLIDTCRQYHIQPVFLTQPDLFGQGIDSVSGINLETFMLEPGLNGKLLWQVLEKYNEVTRHVCNAKEVALIDLAHLMPKNSVYFYDQSHFTNAGAEKVAGLIATKLKAILLKDFPLLKNRADY